MSSISDYNDLLEQIQSISSENTLAPTMPIDVYVQEAENLYHWCNDDKARLVAAGLDWSFVTNLPARAGACREAQSRWIKERKTHQQAEQEWNKKSPEAFNLRDNLTHAFRYAFRSKGDLLSRIADIEQGDTNSDMVQDLNDLSVLGKANVDLLKAIGFDLSLLDTSASVSYEMGDLLGATNGEREKDNEAMVIRDKAYTLLKMAIDEIRECGKYVFWRTPEMLDGYSSDFWKKRNIIKEKVVAPKAEV